MPSVTDVMETKTHTIGPVTTVQEAACIMLEHDVGCLPVVDDGKLVGMLTDRDIVVRAVRQNRSTESAQVAEFMSSPVLACEASDDLEVAVRIMADHIVRRVPVLDSEGHVCGMICLADLALEAEDAASFVLGEVSDPTLSTEMTEGRLYKDAA